MDDTRSDELGLICAYELKTAEPAAPVGWDAIRGWRRDSGQRLWVHLDRTDQNVHRWLGDGSGLDKLVISALLQEETRPRIERIGDGLLVILRGVNLNPGEDPEDMVSLRCWVEADRIITMRKYTLMAVRDLMKLLDDRDRCDQPADVLIEIADRMIARMSPVIEGLDDRLDAMEDTMLESSRLTHRVELVRLRRQSIILRRYIAPQRDVMRYLETEEVPWLKASHRSRMREVADRVTRYVESLDAGRERAAALAEEIAARIADQMNRTMYMLSVVATIFLPLGFLTGLLGINVGGMPGADYAPAFLIVCVLLSVLALIEVAILRWMRWL